MEKKNNINKVIKIIIYICLAFVFFSIVNPQKAFANTTVSGNVKEALTDENAIEPNIAGVKVILTSSQETRYAISDYDGYYEFTDVPEGDYKIEFVYGDTTILNHQNTEIDKYINNHNLQSLTTQDILKYNGHDYYISDLDTNIMDILTDTAETQVLLVIDTSGSMTAVDSEQINDEFNPNSRMSIVKKSAIHLVKEILAISQNTSVGLISFNDTATLETDNFIRSEKTLENKINSLRTGSATNVQAALELAQNTLLNEKKLNSKTDHTVNQIVILLSDGLPEKILSQDINVDWYDEYYDFVSQTKNAVDNLKYNNINLYSLLLYSNSKNLGLNNKNLAEYSEADLNIPDLNQTNYIDFSNNSYVLNYVPYQNLPNDMSFKYNFIDNINLPLMFHRIYNNSEVLVYADNIDDFANIITGDISNWVSDTIITKIKRQYINKTENNGLEDKDRRNLVNSYFSHKFYNNTSKTYDNMSGKSYLFEILENPDNFSDEEIEKLSENTYMTLNFEGIEVTNDSEPITINIKLKRRKAFSIDLYINSTNANLTTSSGKIIDLDISNPNEPIDSPEITDVDLDDALLKIEYELKIANTSAIADCTYLDILSYLPEGFYLDENETLLSDPSITNKEYNWTSLTEEEKNSLVDNGYLFKKKDTQPLDNEDIKIVKQDDLYKSLMKKDMILFEVQNLSLKPNQTLYARFVLSCKIDEINQIDPAPQVISEVIGYQSSTGRRMESKLDSKNNSFIGVYPGNAKPESDYDDSHALDLLFLRKRRITVKGYISEEIMHDSFNLPGTVAGVLVKLTNTEDATKTYTALSDKNGYYEIRNVQIGNYNIEYRYGDISVLKDDDEDLKNYKKIHNIDYLTEQDILKYNGHDYIVSYTKGITETPQKIYDPNSTQIYLVLDNSGSMNSKVNSSTTGETRLDVVKDAAKDLIRDILDSNKNTNIGLVTFATDPDVPLDLTNSKQELYNTIDSLTAEGLTNTDEALSTTHKLIDQHHTDGLKIVILLSDGLPEKYDGDRYIPTTELIEKNLVQNEINYLKDPESDPNHRYAKDDNIKLYSLLIIDKINQYGFQDLDLTKFTEDEIKDIIIDKSEDHTFNDSLDSSHVYITNMHKLYKNSDILRFQETREGLYNCLSADIKEWFKIQKEAYEKSLKEDFEGKDLTKESRTETGLEDPEQTTIIEIQDENNTRRAEVDDYFYNIFHNDASDTRNAINMAEKSYLFEIIENPDKFSYDEKKYLSDNTYMTLTFSNITIDQETLEKNFNIELRRRAEFSLELKTKAVGFRVTLADGTVLREEVIDDEILKSRNIDPSQPYIFIENLDSEAVHGAIIEIEYEVSITNLSEIDRLYTNYLEMVSYLPEGLLLDNNRELISNPKKTNADMGWKTDNIQKYINAGQKNYYVVHNETEYLNRNIASFVNPITIPPKNETRTTRFVLSSCIDDIDDIDYNAKDFVEVIGYNNTRNRRMELKSASADEEYTVSAVAKEPTNSEDQVYYVAPGNISHKYSFVGIYPGDAIGPDSDADKNVEHVLPPTGLEEDNNNTTIYYVIIISILTTITFIIIVYRKSKKHV